MASSSDSEEKGCCSWLSKCCSLKGNDKVHPFLKVAGVSGAVAVMMGSYGAHYFHLSDASDYSKIIFDLANHYHYTHSLALLAVPHTKRPLLTGTLLTAGMVLYCGNFYIQALFGDSPIKILHPVGSTLLIAGWISAAL